MTIARIMDGAVIEYRDIALSDIPEHKRSWWLPVEGSKPRHDPEKEVISGPQITIEANRVLKTWEVKPRTFTEADYAAAIQVEIDATAKAKGYADGASLAGYSTSTIPSWAAEAVAFVAWRDQIWLYAYTELAKVQNGQRQHPTIATLVSELPKITWP